MKKRKEKVIKQVGGPYFRKIFTTYITTNFGNLKLFLEQLIKNRKKILRQFSNLVKKNYYIVNQNCASWKK